MFPETRPRPRRSGIDAEEEKTWVEFYSRVRRDTDLAAEVQGQLDRDPEMKRSHLALYLSCKESMRRAKARHARHRHIASVVRWLARAVFVRPWHFVQALAADGKGITVELLPSSTAGSKLASRSAAQRAARPAGTSPETGTELRRSSRARREGAASPSAAPTGPLSH